MPEPAYSTPQELRTALAGIFDQEAVGRDHGLTMNDLRRRPVIGAHSSRTVRKAIEELRLLAGKPIASTSAGGYYTAADWREKAAFIGECISRIRSLAKLIQVFARESAAALGRQIALDYSMSPAEIAAVQQRAEAVAALAGDDDDA